jgi:pyruvate dehydrogenase E2 component (dihydrolipoamide acetyltransferase)
MATEFSMPKLGLTMEEGTIIEWLVPDGAEVTAGTAVLVVETDKVETEVEVPMSGRLRQTGEVGETYACGAPIGWVGEDADVAVAAPVAAVAAAAPAPAAASASPPPAPPPPPPPSPSPSNTSVPPPPTAPLDVAPVTIPAAASNGGRAFVSPNARRVAAELGIDVTTITGTGPGGRIVSEDVEQAAAVASTPAPAPSPALAAAPVAAVVAPASLVPMRGMRATIASRMHASLHEMAQLTLTMDADMDAVWADREARKARGNAPGFTDYVIAAAAQALRAHPMVNSQVTPDGIAVLPDVHVGMAVALDNGLVVPVVHQTDRLRLDAIAAETTRLATAARAGKLTLAEMEGGTFSVTSLGMYGVDAFTPVINPPNAAILGVGRIRDDVAWSNESFRRVRRMTLSLTWDHRVIDGAPAAEFCRTIVDHLENPSTLG